MIVKVRVQGGFVVIENEDRSLSMTTAATAPILARMQGRAQAFFVATAKHGGGKKDWADGKGEVEYSNPSEIVDLGEALPEQTW